MNTIFKKTASYALLITSLALCVGLAVPQSASAETFNRQMQSGMTGTDISSLQTFLAQDVSLYPQGLVTGYFGFLTKSAVANFQSRNNLPAVGRVGPATLPILNAQYQTGMNNGGGMVSTNSDGRSATIASVGVSTNNNSAQISWTTDELAQGTLFYSATPLATYERTNSVDVSGYVARTDFNLKTSQSVSMQGLQPNTRYYYLIYATDQEGNVSVSWPTSFVTAQ